MCLETNSSVVNSPSSSDTAWELQSFWRVRLLDGSRSRARGYLLRATLNMVVTDTLQWAEAVDWVTVDSDRWPQSPYHRSLFALWRTYTHLQYVLLLYTLCCLPILSPPLTIYRTTRVNFKKVWETKSLHFYKNYIIWFNLILNNSKNSLQKMNQLLTTTIFSTISCKI